MRRETSQEIDAEAASWAARVDNGPLSPEDDERLERWLAGDTRRHGAFMRLRAVALHSERAKALGAGYDPANFGHVGDNIVDDRLSDLRRSQTMRSRRNFLWLGGSAAAACAAALAVFAFVPGGDVYDSAVGQVRVVSLADGSVITLNTDTKIHVRYGRERRLVTLDGGEALFDVAKDRSRPFVVEAAGTSVTAVGTSFVVKKLAAAPVEIVVREGTVDVRREVAPRPIRMTANSKLVSSSTLAPIAPVTLAPGTITRELAWKSGQIAFEGETLAYAAQAFERYSGTRIIIEDPSLEREEITGLFASNDPVGFARAVALSLGLNAKVGPNEVRLSRS